MTTLIPTHSRDEFGFLIRRTAKHRPAPVSTRLLAISMLTCWIAASGLSVFLSLNWLP